jgi:hypothetical protein
MRDNRNFESPEAQHYLWLAAAAVSNSTTRMPVSHCDFAMSREGAKDDPGGCSEVMLRLIMSFTASICLEAH